MNEEQIILSLIAFYKEQGIDLHHLLDDPIFNSFPVAKKVELIKQYAAQLHNGIHNGFSRDELKRSGKSILGKALLGGLMGRSVGAVAAKAFSGGRMGPMAIPIGMISGASTGAAYALLGSYDQLSDKRRMRNQLAEVARKKTDDSALRALALRSLQIRKPSNELADVLKKVEDITGPASLEKSVTHAVDEYNSKNLGLKKNQ